MINDITEFKNVLMVKLGHPILKVNDITDEQMDIAISDAIRKFHNEATGTGTIESVLAVPTSGGVADYDIPSEVHSIIDSFDNSSIGGIGVLFSHANMLYNDGVFGGIGDPMPNILTLQMQMDQLRMLQVLMGQKFTAIHSPHEGKITIQPTPPADGILYFQIYRKVPEIDLYNNEWVEEYASALCKIQIGRNRSKYDGVTLPGGGSLNGSAWLDEGKEEKTALEEELRTRWDEPPDFYVG